MASLRSNSVTLVIVVLITLALGSASSSAATEPACDAPLRDIVKVQNFPVAYICAKQRLALDPDNIDAMLVLARAAQELGQFELADTLAQKARGYQLNTGQKFAAYLISGIAQANQSKFLSAKVLLYRASDFARAEPERRLIREVLAQLNARSPWKFSASASLNPSTNINGGSLHDTIEFAGLEFSLDEDAQAQPGIGYSANVQLAHQTRLSTRSIWENKAQVAGTFFAGRGRNNLGYTLTSGLSYTISPSSQVHGYLSYSEGYIASALNAPALTEYSPHYAQTSVGAAYHSALFPDSSWSTYVSYSARTSAQSQLQDALIATLGGAYSIARGPQMFTFGGYIQDTEALGADTAARAANLWVGITRDVENTPLTLSGKLGYTHTEYKYLMGGYADVRVDDDVSLELSATRGDIQFFGFNPVLGVVLKRNHSNLGRYDTQSAQLFTRLTTSF